jgi:hypothetical protein
MRVLEINGALHFGYLVWLEVVRSLCLSEQTFTDALKSYIASVPGRTDLRCAQTCSNTATAMQQHVTS